MISSPGSIRRKGPNSLGLHADNSWFPAPFPAWEIMCTGCFVTDEFTLEGGSTLVIPGTHTLKQHPPKDVRKTLEGAQREKLRRQRSWMAVAAFVFVTAFAAFAG